MNGYIKLFASVTPKRPSFMVTITAGLMPTMLASQPHFSAIRQAVIAAVRNGMLLLYLVPSAKMILRLQGHGQLHVFEASEYANGYKELSGEIGETYCRMIACDQLDIAHPHYVTALIGETTHNSWFKRVVERGPLTGDNTVVLTDNPDYEIDMARYVARLLKDDNHDAFTKDLIKRMNVI